MGHPGVEQPSGEVLACRGLADDVAGDQPLDRERPGTGEPEDADRRATDQDAARVGTPRRRVQSEAERRRQSAVQLAVIPASTGSTAPVMAPLSGPQIHARRAATSSGSTRRPS